MVLKKIKKLRNKKGIASISKLYHKRFKKYAFTDCQCVHEEQFEASIIRLYHTIEKGLSYEDYRAGFGRANVEKLISSLEQYAQKGYDTSGFSYETAISCLNEYVKKNREYNMIDKNLEERIQRLPGKSNAKGGVIRISASSGTNQLDYKELILKRHSIRHFSNEPIELSRLVDAIKLSQHTPSACNRQGWKTRVVAEKSRIEEILSNQNGNRGFGNEIDKLLVITADLRMQQKSREYFQAFIDGGMYAETVINSLFYYGIGCVPLSASLTPDQESKVRRIVGMDEAEVLIMFIGCGNNPHSDFLTTRSERKPIEVEIII